MRVVVVSAHPALLLALGSQAPDFHPVSARSVSEAVESAVDGALILLDVASEDEVTRWLEGLHEAGLSDVIILVDAPAAASRASVPHLERPFSVSNLTSALKDLSAKRGMPADQQPVEGSAEEASSPGSSPLHPERTGGAAEEGGTETMPPLPAANQAATTDSTAGPLGAGDGLGNHMPPDEAWSGPPCAQGQPEANELDEVSGTDRSTTPTSSQSSPQDAEGRSNLQQNPTQSSETPSESLLPGKETSAWLLGLRQFFRPRRDASDATVPKADEAAIGSRVKDGLRAALALEQLLSDLGFLTSVSACGNALLEEIAESMDVGSSALALRSRHGDLEVIATGGVQAGIAGGRLDLDHPFVRLTEQHGGAVLVAPTDEARGLLAGVPVSNWPALLAVALFGDDTVDGIVLVGQEDDPERGDLDRLAEKVDLSAAVIRLAAAVWRMQDPGSDASTFVHSWMR